MTAPSNLLLLHACTDPGFAALALGGRLEVVPLDGSNRERRPLLDAVREVLEKQEARLDAVEGLVVSVGPGSFTGIRVGIATAQGLAASRHWPIWTCDSLLMYAAPWGQTDLPVAVCHDARRGEVYAALYDVTKAVPLPLVPPFSASPAVARERLQKERGDGMGLRWTGTGVALVGQGDLDARIQEDSPERLGAALRELAMVGGLPSFPSSRLEPFYLRRPDVRPPHAAAQ